MDTPTAGDGGISSWPRELAFLIHSYLYFDVFQQARIQCMKVLVVDDVGFNRILVSQVLEKHGHEVIQAMSGDRALVLLARDPEIKLIVADYMMPGMNGIEFIKQVHASVRYSDSGIIQPPTCILLTAVQDFRMFQEAKKAGYKEVLLKPLDAKRLLQFVDETAAALIEQTESHGVNAPSLAKDATLLQLQREINEAINTRNIQRLYAIKNSVLAALRSIDESGVLL
jgi:CheY-like chemotaxis protein